MHRVFSLAVGGLALALAACAPAAPQPAAPAAPKAAAPAAAPAAPTAAPQAATRAEPPPRATVRMGWRSAAVSDGAILLALERGYLNEQGIDLEFVSIPSTPAMMAPLSQNQIEIATGGINAALWNAVANDVPIKVVADKGSMTPPAYQAFLVRTDLADQIRDWSDLRGRKVAVNATGSADHLNFLKALARGGLTEDDTEMVILPWPDHGQALTNRAIDAAISVEPVQSRFIAQGIATKWRGLDELSPNQQTAAIYYGPGFAASDVATRFMIAYVRGARDYNDAFMKGINREDAIAVFMKHVSGVDRPLYDQMSMPGINPNGRVNRASIEEDLAGYLASGQVKQPVDVARVVDDTFADAAVRALGGEYK